MGKQPFLRQSITASLRWLSLGIGIKRWLILLGIGAGITGMGLVYLILVLDRVGWLPQWLYDGVTLQFLPVWGRVLIPLTVGSIVILWAVAQIGVTLMAPFGYSQMNIVESLYDYQRGKRGPHIVAIGGGTGMPSLLRGLREYTQNITAIVTVADDGGSSGRLRRELGMLPPGDFRNNMAALSNDEALMTQLLQYRFGGSAVEGKGELQGHAFGNLLLAALTGITGSFDEALLAAERVLAMRGRVLPSTLESVTLAAEVEVMEGETAVLHHIVGESAIPKVGGSIKEIKLNPAAARAYPPTLQAVFQADLIIIGPGSLYTSILPNLLIPDLAQALAKARARKVYICNLATQPGETDNYSVADHVATVLQHISTNFLDIVLANNNLAVSPTTGGGQTVFVQPTPPTQVHMITADLVDESRPWRHDSTKLAKAVMSLLT